MNKIEWSGCQWTAMKVSKLNLHFNYAGKALLELFGAKNYFKKQEKRLAWIVRIQ